MICPLRLAACQYLLPHRTAEPSSPEPPRASARRWPPNSPRAAHNLIVTARRGEDLLTELATRLTERYGVTVEVRAVDLADPSANGPSWPTNWPAQTSRSCAPTRVPRRSGRWRNSTRRAKKLRFSSTPGVHDLALAVLPGMMARKAGGILISGSAAGNSPIPNNATYAATKAFANTFSESLRGELKGSASTSRCWRRGRCAPSCPTRPKRRWWSG